MFRIIFLLYFLLTKSVLAVSFPQATGFVTDTANVINDQDQLVLENRLQSLDQSTGNQIAILTIPSLNGLTIEEYAQKIFENWQIGQKKLDNGLLILVSTGDRQVRLEVGYGLEGYITDARSGDIIRQQLGPEFKNNNYYQGLVLALDTIESYLLAAPAAPSAQTTTSDSSFLSYLPLCFTFLIYFSSFLARSKSFWAGGVIGLLIGLIFFSWTWSLVLGLIGLLLDFILSRNYKSLQSAGLSTNFWHSSGGFKSSSSFGGFGGGRSGGGGASGRF